MAADVQLIERVATLEKENEEIKMILRNLNLKNGNLQSNTLKVTYHACDVSGSSQKGSYVNEEITIEGKCLHKSTYFAVETLKVWYLA